MSETTELILMISFYILLPIFFLITRKKMIKAEKKESGYVGTLKQAKKWIKKTCISLFIVISIYLVFCYKHLISYPIQSMNFVLILLAMLYFPILYMLFVIIPCIKEKEKEN